MKQPRPGVPTHGMSDTKLYGIWEAMVARCSNPKNKRFEHYGGRGIKVCPEWRDFANFYRDMGERPEGMTLDRIDVDGNYEPDNCRWATHSEQNANRRPARTCRNGHPFTEETTQVAMDNTRGYPRRRCRICQRAAQARYDARRRERTAR